MRTLIGEVPSSWSLCTLGEVCEIQPGPAATALRAAPANTLGVPVVTPSAIKNNKISEADAPRVTLESAARLRKYLLMPGDIVCVRIGNTQNHATCYDEHADWLVGNACIRLRPHDDISPAYLDCYLDHPAVRQWLIDAAAAKTVRRVVTGQDLKSMPFVIPPETTQTAITDTVDTLDEQINVHRAIATTTAMIRAAVLPLLLAGTLDARS